MKRSRNALVKPEVFAAAVNKRLVLKGMAPESYFVTMARVSFEYQCTFVFKDADGVQCYTSLFYTPLASFCTDTLMSPSCTCDEIIKAVVRHYENLDKKVEVNG